MVFGTVCVDGNLTGDVLDNIEITQDITGEITIDGRVLLLCQQCGLRRGFRPAHPRGACGGDHAAPHA